jgi:hypothetical protein
VVLQYCNDRRIGTSIVAVRSPAMNQTVFYICGVVGIIIAAALGYYLEHFSLTTVVISAIVTAVFIIGVGIWRRKHVLK